MSSENQFFNFHMDPSCSNNTKIGFQSLNSDVAALKKNLSVCRKWAKQGALKDGDIITVYAKYTETDAAAQMQLAQLTLADGTTRDLPTPDEPSVMDEDFTEEKSDIPF